MRHAVIVAGGSGERFWPVSTPDRPKQFLPLGGDVSLIRATYRRLSTVVPAERIWVVTLRVHARRVKQELPEIDSSHILGEPQGMNTAPALQLAALAVDRKDPRAVMAVVPADAWAPRVAPYRKALREALQLAQGEDRLVLIGVRPTRIETGYGYIEPGEKISRSRAHTVRKFVEKPTQARARRFVVGGRHLWNCGIFAWKPRVYMDAVARHLPELDRAFAPLRVGRWTPARLKDAYARAPRISVDYGVLERAGNVAVIPASFPWDDLGSWRALERLGRQGYRKGSVISWDSPGLIAWAEQGTVAVIGVPEVVVVHTRHATLVVSKERAQEVREIVARMEKD